MSFNLKALITEPHIRLALAFIIAYIGYVFPDYKGFCDLLSGYLGMTIVVSAAKAMQAMAAKG